MTSLSGIRTTVSVTAAGLLLGAGVLAPAPASASASAAGGPGAANWGGCRADNICFYSDYDGWGSVCQWGSTEPNARPTCSWMAEGDPAKSVMNLSDHRVYYFHQASCENRIGSTVAGDYGDLTGTYTIGSLGFGTTTC